MDAQAQLQKILTKRIRWVEANRENGFEEGILRLLSDLYPDQAHFIYELLQNAEDAGASAVTFTLEPNAFACRHNGSRIFNLADVESITSIGKSTKRDDINQIGKFGVGFKAVFSYTNTPTVFSGDYAFEIRDLVCPHPVTVQQRMDTSTLFRFPFNRREKVPESCFAEITGTLSTLSENTLMFLDNIKEVSWTIEGQPGGSVRTVDHGQGILQIEHRSVRHRPNSTYWLRFQEPYDSEHKLRVASAFALSFRDAETTVYDSRKPIRDQFKIVAADGRLCIYFPADRETTKLRFHIHGPYASTVDRASIPHTQQNKTLVDATGRLTATSLQSIKDLGLLDRNLLAVLPNTSDEIDPFYEPILDAITAAMRTAPLVPTDSGGHATSTELIQSPRPIRALLGVERLSFFLADENTRWAIGCMQNSREDQFLRSLAIREWGWNEFVASLCARFENAEDDELEGNLAWLAAQEDNWMMSLYAALYRALDDNDVYDFQVNDCRFVRLEDSTHVKGRDAFFPDPHKREELRGLPTVKKLLLVSAKNKDADRTRSFLEQMGVKVIDEEQEVRLILNKWYIEGTACPDDEEHLKHIHRFIEYVQKQQPRHTKSAAAMFRDVFLFQDATKEHYRKPSECVLDAPYAPTGLTLMIEKEIPSFADKNTLWPGYTGLLDQDFRSFAAAVGVITHLPIETLSTRTNPYSSALRKGDYCARRSSRGIDVDYTIRNLDLIVQCADPRMSRIVWETMCSADRDVLMAQYRPNSQFDIRTSESLLVLQLRQQAWIPGTDGNFYRPCDIAQDRLMEGFPYNDTNGWLTAIHFGANIIRMTEDFQRKQSALQSIGIPGDFLEAWERVPAADRPAFGATLLEFVKKQAKEQLDAKQDAPITIASYKSHLNDSLTKPAGKLGNGTHDVDESEVADPVRRRRHEEANIDEDLNGEPTPSGRFKILPRKVWDSKRAEVRVFLEQQYGGKCQICNSGFEKRTGDAFFVALYLVSHTTAQWTDRPGNVLCVCANCAAKLQHGSVDANRIEDQILHQHLAREGGQSPLTLTITLCGELSRITFSERHFLALQEIVRKSHE